jgi:formylmethanofuran dehydrogenase subunit E
MTWLIPGIFIGLAIGFVALCAYAACVASGNATRCEECGERFIQMDVFDVDGTTITTWIKRRDFAAWQKGEKNG